MNTDSTKKKEALRRRGLAARRAFSPGEVAHRSARICVRLEALPEFQQAAAILSYVDSKDHEVQTQPLIRGLLEQNRPVLVPIAQSNGAMLWSRLHSLNELFRARFNILEPHPEHYRLSQPPAHAVCLVPALLFSPEGYRIGYGGGFYDRFLSTFDGLSIGLAFQKQIPEDLPIESHDRPVDIVVTEENTYY